jgi:exonuclease III
MLDHQISILTWNVQGISCPSTRRIKRKRLRTHLKTIFPKPGLVFIQEYKMTTELCDKLGVMGFRRGKALWLGAVVNPDTGQARRGTCILLNAQMQHIVIDDDIIVANRAQWVIYQIESHKIGFLNIYAPNQRRERATFWDEVCQGLPDADSWVLGGNINMVENEEDRSGNPPKRLSREEQGAWDNLTLRSGLQDVWQSNDFSHEGSLPFSWSNRKDN